MTTVEEIQAAIDAAREEGRDVPRILEELLLALAAKVDGPTPAGK